MKDPVTLPSGAKLTLNIAPLSDSLALKKAVAKELAALQLDIAGMASDETTSGGYQSFLKIGLQLLASSDVEAKVHECMKRCAYNAGPATLASFEDENARQDYLPAVWEVMDLNLRPFGDSLVSLLSKFSPKSKGSKETGQPSA